MLSVERQQWWKETISRVMPSAHIAHLDYLEEQKSVWTEADNEDVGTEKTTTVLHSLEAKVTPALYECVNGNVSIRVLKDDDDDIRVEFCNVNPTYVNDLRHIIVNDLPSMAIYKIVIGENNGIQSLDEYLAPRLGMLPIKVNPLLFGERKWNDEATDLNTLVFKLDTRCVPKENPTPTAESDDVESRFLHSTVYGKDLDWVPIGKQAAMFEGVEPPSITPPDAVITMLDCGQEVSLLAFAKRGTQVEHANYSPIAAARAQPKLDIKFHKSLTGATAVKLAKTCKRGVFGTTASAIGDLEDLVMARSSSSSTSSLHSAAAVDPNVRPTIEKIWACNLCQECMRPQWNEHLTVKLSRSHFLLAFESNGSMPARDYFRMMIDIYNERQRIVVPSMS